VHNSKGYLKLHCSLTTQGKNCEYHPAHSFLFIIILGGYMLLFLQSNMRSINCVWQVVSTSVTWQLQNLCTLNFQFIKNNLDWCQSPYIKNNYKIGLWGNFGKIHGLLSCEVCFFVYCVINRIVDRGSRRHLCIRARLRLWLQRKREK